MAGEGKEPKEELEEVLKRMREEYEKRKKELAERREKLVAVLRDLFRKATNIGLELIQQGLEVFQQEPQAMNYLMELLFGRRGFRVVVKVGSQGRITIPEGIREYLGIEEGDLLVIDIVSIRRLIPKEEPSET